LTIAWHLALNRRHSLTRWMKRTVIPTSRSTDDEAQWTDVASADDSPEQRVVAMQLRTAIVEEIRRLTPTLRDVLLLAQSGEYTYQEIGDMVGAPVGTIKWRVSEARRVIKARLKQRGFDDVG